MREPLFVALLGYLLAAPMTPLIALDPTATIWADPLTYAHWVYGCAAALGALAVLMAAFEEVWR